MTEQFSIQSGLSFYSCTRFGTGPAMAVCFHGYGEEGKSFSLLQTAALEGYSFYCPDLPGHGSTVRSGDTALDPDELLSLVNQLRERHVAGIGSARGIQPDPMAKSNSATRRYTLVGFSLGGRVALRLYQQDPASVERLVLFAPDGLKFNFWYSFSTGTWAGRKLFRFTISHNQWFMALLGLVTRLKLINAGLIRFVRMHLEKQSDRELLYRRWMLLRHMNPDIVRISSCLKQHQTKTMLVYGLYDRIITPSAGRRLLGKAGINGQIIELPSGHQLLQPKNIAGITNALIG